MSMNMSMTVKNMNPLRHYEGFENEEIPKEQPKVIALEADFYVVSKDSNPLEEEKKIEKTAEKIEKTFEQEMREWKKNQETEIKKLKNDFRILQNNNKALKAENSQLTERIVNLEKLILNINEQKQILLEEKDELKKIKDGLGEECAQKGKKIEELQKEKIASAERFMKLQNENQDLKRKKEVTENNLVVAENVNKVLDAEKNQASNDYQKLQKDFKALEEKCADIHKAREEEAKVAKKAQKKFEEQAKEQANEKAKIEEQNIQLAGRIKDLEAQLKDPKALEEKNQLKAENDKLRQEIQQLQPYEKSFNNIAKMLKERNLLQVKGAVYTPAEVEQSLSTTLTILKRSAEICAKVWSKLVKMNYIDKNAKYSLENLENALSNLMNDKEKIVSDYNEACKFYGLPEMSSIETLKAKIKEREEKYKELAKESRDLKKDFKMMVSRELAEPNCTRAMDGIKCLVTLGYFVPGKKNKQAMLKKL